MMKKFLLLCLILLMCTPAFAVNLKDVELGGMVRVRGYQFDNMWTFDSKNDVDRWEVFRSKTSLFTKVHLTDNVSGYVQLTNQTYGSGIPEKVSATGVQTDGENLDDKVFVDNAYIDINNLWNLKPQISLRIGRQNMMYGSGFVLFDGQSQFASTSLYFDGAKATFKFSDAAVLDAFYLKDQENDRSDVKNDDVTLSGAYFTGKWDMMGGQQELYALNRNDQGLSKNIWMVGMRLSNKNLCAQSDYVGLDYSGEVAYQFGDFNSKEDIKQNAWGTKLDAGLTLKKAPLTPRISLGYAFMQGDNPNTKDNERWDVFYGGWPQFGDLLAWTYVNVPFNAISQYDKNWNIGSSTPGEAVYSNLMIPTVALGLQFPCSISSQVSYSRLIIDKPDAHRSNNFGDYFQLKTKYSYSPNLDFSVYAGLIDPGHAFTYQNRSYEVFWETCLKF